MNKATLIAVIILGIGLSSAIAQNKPTLDMEKIKTSKHVAVIGNMFKADF